MEKIKFIFLRSIVGNDPSFKDKEREIFLSKLNENNDFVFTDSGREIFFIETGGTEEQFKKIFTSHSEPYILLATNANNSLPASLEIATFLRKNNKKFVLIHGTPEEVRNKILSGFCGKKAEICRDFLKTDLLKNMRFGVIGKPSDWLIASDVDYKKFHEDFGGEIIDISTEEFLKEIDEKKSAKLTSKFDQYSNEKVSQETIKGALQIYEAISSLVKRYKLDGVTVRCFDLLDSVKNTSCLALAMLNEEGIIATCEGDVPTMLSMAIIKKAFNESSFQVNPSYLNLDQKYGYFAHCTLPLNMCKSFSFDTHFESGIGLGVKGELKEQDVTIFKMNANLKDYEIFEGKIVENLHKNNLCRTQVKVEFEENIDSMFTSPNGNHLVIAYGAHKHELVKILSN